MPDRAFRLIAPAKINWTLEVLARRDDGYHELRTVLQTIDLCDTVTVRAAAGLSLAVRGEAASTLGPPSANLALRAAELLRSRYGIAAGANIELDKRIPVAAGLGGGSSDAAAVLRGLARLWRLDLADDALAALGAELGSDVPFFIYAGTALAEGRGERVTPLPDAPAGDIALLPGSGPDEKTSRLFSLLRPADFADGSASAELARALERGAARSLDDIDRRYRNSFDGPAVVAFPGVAERRSALAAATGHPARLAGAGPSLFACADAATPLLAGAVLTHPLARAAALAVEDVP